MSDGGPARVAICTGARFERYDEAGWLLQPTPETMAENAFRAQHGEWTVPQIVWIKEHAGQVTDGRVGRPAVRYAPLSWLPKSVGDEVKALLARLSEENRDE